MRAWRRARRRIRSARAGREAAPRRAVDRPPHQDKVVDARADPLAQGQRAGAFRMGEVNVDLTKEVRMLPVKLTADEQRERGVSLATKLGEKLDLELSLKDHAEDEKTKIKAADKEAQRLLTIVRSGEEPREVECRWTADYETSQMICFRMDTGEQIDSRPMTLKERTRNLFPIDGGRGAEASDTAS